MQHMARSNSSLSSHSSEESHWRSSDSSTEASYLSVLKNNVSDTRGLNFYCRRFLSSEELHSQSSDSSTEVSYLSVLKNNVSDTRGLNFYCRRFLSSEELHSQSSDSSTEVSYLSVLKNNVSDTRGLNFYCRRFPQGFSSGFLIEHFLRSTELIFLNPSNSAVFSYDSRSIKSLSKDYASTLSSARTSSGSSSASASTERFRILFLQDSATLHSSGNTPTSSMFLNILGGQQWWLNSSSGTVLLCILTNTSVPQPFRHQILQNLKGALDALTGPRHLAAWVGLGSPLALLRCFQKLLPH